MQNDKFNDLSFVQNLLKRFNIIVYTGNPLDDYTIMELELQDLYDTKIIDQEDYFKAKRVLNRLTKER